MLKYTYLITQFELIDKNSTSKKNYFIPANHKTSLENRYIEHTSNLNKLVF